MSYNTKHKVKTKITSPSGDLISRLDFILLQELKFSWHGQEKSCAETRTAYKD